MKTLLLLLGCCLFWVSPLAAQETAEAAKPAYTTVYVNFKSSATKEDIEKLESTFRALKTQIPEITALEWGPNDKLDEKKKRYTHKFSLHFQSSKDRETCRAHPAYKAFWTSLKPVLGDRLIAESL